MERYYEKTGLNRYISVHNEAFKGTTFVVRWDRNMNEAASSLYRTILTNDDHEQEWLGTEQR